jgi:nicotinamidase-related amidase
METGRLCTDMTGTSGCRGTSPAQREPGPRSEVQFFKGPKRKTTILNPNWIHLCIDMQRMFAEETPWHVAWMAKVSPAVAELVARHPERTLFTRFIPPARADQMPGAWQAYYRKWEDMTRERIGEDMLDLVPELRRFVPPARIFDKMTYSPWISGKLHAALQAESVDTLVVTGGETDVCVLAAVLGAIDLGYRVRLLTDAVCSGADDTHDASLALLGDRFSVQLELLETESFLRDASRVQLR